MEALALALTLLVLFTLKLVLFLLMVTLCCVVVAPYWRRRTGAAADLHAVPLVALRRAVREIKENIVCFFLEKVVFESEVRQTTLSFFA